MSVRRLIAAECQAASPLAQSCCRDESCAVNPRRLLLLPREAIRCVRSLPWPPEGLYRARPKAGLWMRHHASAVPLRKPFFPAQAVPAPARPWRRAEFGRIGRSHFPEEPRGTRSRDCAKAQCQGRTEAGRATPTLTFVAWGLPAQSFESPRGTGASPWV